MYFPDEIKHEVTITTLGNNWQLSDHSYLDKNGIDYQGSTIVKGSIEAIARYLQCNSMSPKRYPITFIGLTRDEFLDLLEENLLY